MMLLATLLTATLVGEPGVALRLERPGDGQTQVYADNHLAGPVDVTLRGDPDMGGSRLHIRALLQAGESRRLAIAGPAPVLDLQHVPGAPMVLPPETATLALPFASNTRWQLSQGFGGEASHRSADNWHALDFAVPVGTAVLAASPGTVMEVVDGYVAGGTDPDLKDRANRVRVLQADGCMVVYAHLQAGSARVAPGQRVVRGQPLARSGNTGWSAAPHLHLSVQCNLDGELLTVPFRVGSAQGLLPTTLPEG